MVLTEDQEAAPPPGTRTRNLVAWLTASLVAVALLIGGLVLVAWVFLPDESCSRAAPAATRQVMDDIRAAARLGAGRSTSPSICNSGWFARERTWTFDAAEATRRLETIQSALVEAGWKVTVRPPEFQGVGATYERTVMGVDLTAIVALDPPTGLRASVIEF